MKFVKQSSKSQNPQVPKELKSSIPQLCLKLKKITTTAVSAEWYMYGTVQCPFYSHEVQSKLDYLNLNYPDFLIIWTLSLVPILS